MAGQYPESGIRPTDGELIREFRDHRTESAFGELVRRHVNLVYGTAMRSVRHHALAEEVAQNVFIALAKRADSIPVKESLAGWLYQTAVLESRQAIRGEVRRQNRQHVAAELGTTMKEPCAIPESVSEVLDDALMALPEADRRALLLRYFEDRSHREIGHLLGAGEDAARKRINKALEQLGNELQRRGYPAATAAVAASVLTSAGAMTAPASLATTCTHAAIAAAASATAAGGIGLLAARLMSLTKTQTAVLCAAAALIPMGLQWKRVRVAQTEYEALQAQWVAMTADINNLTVTNRIALDLAEKQRRSLETVQREITRQEQYAQNLQTNLYAWSPTSDYIRVPKTLLPSIHLYVDLSAPNFGGRPRGTSEPILSKAGELSRVLREALGMTEEETRSFQAFYGDAETQLNDLAETRRTVSEGHPTSYSSGMPHSQTLATEPYPEEGKSVKDSLVASIAELLGQERTQALMEQIDEEMVSRFAAYGRMQHFESIFWDDQGHFTTGWGDMDPASKSFWRNSVGGTPQLSEIDPALLALLPPDVLEKARAREAANSNPRKP